MRASYVEPALVALRRVFRAIRPGLVLPAAFLLLSSGAAGDWSGGGPEIGWIRTLLETDDQTLYAGTYGGGIFRSTDGGLTWTEATTNARDTVVLDLLQARDANGTLFAAAADRTLLRKENNSDFWFSLGGFPTGDQPPGVSVTTFPDRPQRIAFGSEYGVFMSNNLGANWPDTLQFFSGAYVNDLEVLPELPNTVHAVSPLELVVTSNNGQSETFITAGLAPVTFLIDLEPWSTGTDSMVVADQRGPVWQLINRDHFVEVGPVEAGPPSNKYVTRIDPTDPDRVYLGSSAGLWLSEDRMASWDLVDDMVPAYGAEVWAIEPTRTASTDTLRLGSFTLGFVRTGPGGAGPWTMSNSGLTAAWARTVDPVAGSVLCGTAHGRLYRSADEGVSWQDVTGGLRTLQISVSHQTSTAWVVSGFDGVVRSVDDGVTWNPSTVPTGVLRLNHLLESDGQLIAATNAGIVVSADDGITFTHAPGLPASRSSFAIAALDSGRIAVGFEPPSGSVTPSIFVGDFVGGFTEYLPPVGFRGRVRGVAQAGDGIVVGTNGFGGSPLYRIGADASYTDLSAGVDDGFFEVRDLASRANVLALGTASDGVFLSEDLGQTWREFNEGLPTLRIEAVELAAAPSREVWVATLGRGAFRRSLDPGVAVAVSGLRAEPTPGGVRVSLEVHGPVQLRVRREGPGSDSAVLFAGTTNDDLSVLDSQLPRTPGRVAYVVETGGEGNWTELMRVERSVEELIPPRRSRLVTAAPNPFNPRTELHFELALAGPSRLEVFDARGRRVRRLVDRELPAGPHTVTFDGTDDQGTALASGVYYLLLRAADGEQRGRITLVR